jgi:hypothetical protein
MAPKSGVGLKRYRSTMPECLREILIPQAWKELHQAAGDYEENRSRWRLQPLIHVALGMALDQSPTVGERFDVARDLDAVLRPQGRVCGRTVAGFAEALSQLPLGVGAAFRKIMQQHLTEMCAHPARVGRWEAFALDGSKQNLPRTDANAAFYGAATKEPAMPQGLTVAAVALGQGVLWDWASGSSLDSERALALQIIARLPAGALGVLDAGFAGYGFIKQALQGGVHLLLRVGANVKLLAEQLGHVQRQGGYVWLWPEQQRKEKPLHLRLIKVVELKRKRIKRKGSRRRQWKKIQKAVWLLTDVLDEQALTDAEAADIFKRRWGGNEIRFRDWKCTLNCETLFSRTPQLAQIETEMSLCAAMLLQVMGALAQHTRKKALRPVSMAQMARAWRRGVRKVAQGKNTAWFGEQIGKAVADIYLRTQPKVKRRWPKRKDHRWPGQPKFRKLTQSIKTLGLARLAKRCAC